MKKVEGVDRTVEMEATAEICGEGLPPRSGYRHEGPEESHRTTPWIASSQRLTLLLDLIARINSMMDLPSLLAAIMEAAKVIMEAEASSLMLLDQETQELITDVTQ